MKEKTKKEETTASKMMFAISSKQLKDIEKIGVSLGKKNWKKLYNARIERTVTQKQEKKRKNLQVWN